MGLGIEGLLRFREQSPGEGFLLRRPFRRVFELKVTTCVTAKEQDNIAELQEFVWIQAVTPLSFIILLYQER